VLGRGGPAFDTVILDAPATGHGLEMLRVPKVIVDAVPPSALRRDAERAWSMFKDPEQSGIVVVTLPEEMPVNETFELVSGLQNELELPIAKLIINATLPYLFEPDEWNELEGAQGLDPKVDGDRALLAGQRRSSRER